MPKICAVGDLALSLRCLTKSIVDIPKYARCKPSACLRSRRISRLTTQPAAENDQEVGRTESSAMSTRYHGVLIASQFPTDSHAEASHTARTGFKDFIVG